MTANYLMSTNTGSVDTEDNLAAEGFTVGNADLLEVKLANGEEVPADFNPTCSDNYEWVEA